jgi:hypothetical protein
MAKKKASGKRKTGADIPTVETTALVKNPVGGVTFHPAAYGDCFGNTPNETEAEVVPDDEPVTVEARIKKDEVGNDISEMADKLSEVLKLATVIWMAGEAYRRSDETDAEAAARTVSESIARRKKLDGLEELWKTVNKAIKDGLEGGRDRLDARIFSICEDGHVSTERARKYFEEKPLLAGME